MGILGTRTPIALATALPTAAHMPIAGGSPRQLTRFTDKRPIGSLAWSRDGKRLALTRSTITNDIVLFSGLK